ncbi:MAG: hypothetical protein JWQ27_3086 [Ferruginibacter sp.]|nr:hypothetical protein [Ferruginibacter sp.]
MKKLFVVALIAAAFSSCAKEELIPVPVKGADTTKSAIVFIRAVNKDSSTVESERILLR